MNTLVTVAVVVAVLALIVLALAVRVVKQYERGVVNCCMSSARWCALIACSGIVAVAGWAITKPIRCAQSLRRQVKHAGTGSASGTRPVRVERTWRLCKTSTCTGCGQ